MIDVARNGKTITCTDGVWTDENGDEYQQCEDCGDFELKEHSTNLGWKNVCNWCRDEAYVKCDKCGEWADIEYTYPVVTIGGRGEEIRYDRYCESCAEHHTFFCERCEERYEDEFFYQYIEVGDFRDCCLCEACCNDLNVVECDECGRIVATPYHDEETDRWLCNDCCCSLDDEDDYSAPPPPATLTCYHKTKYLAWLGDPDELHMGVELEIDKGGSSEENVQQISKQMGEGYAEYKRDGSLYNGFEIASAPSTLWAHVNTVGWREMMDTAIALGYRSHNTTTCGLHVHIDRGYFNLPGYIYEEKIAMLFGNNHEWLKRFSRRSDFEYCRVTYEASKKTTPEEAKQKGSNAKPEKGNRYLAINYQTGINTIEFRLFKGTLKYQTFIATLQCVQMFCDFVKSLEPEQLATIDMNSFIQNAKDRAFVEFINYLGERRLIES